MKPVRLIAAPSSIVLGLFFGCSDPPSPPAQAGIVITVGQSAGQCPVPGSPISVPPDPAGQQGVVNAALLCDLTHASCKPDDYVVVNGDGDATVTCSVSPQGDGSFNIDLQLSTTRLSFSASGKVTSSGGDIRVSVYEQTSGTTITTDKTTSSCKVTIPANQGTAKKGALWARFTCDGLSDPKDSSGTICKASGQFIFENCSS
ncbi:MAG TPA: hypothetical protein VF395_06320 [Polyangiaceae bacterium]